MAHRVTLLQLARHLGHSVPGVALEPVDGEAPAWLCTLCLRQGWILWRTDDGQLRASDRGGGRGRDVGRSVVGMRPERGEECASCAVNGIGVWAGHRWLRLQGGRLVAGELAGEPGVAVSNVVVDETLLRRAAIATRGIVAVDRDGHLITTWLPGTRIEGRVPRLVRVR